VLRLLIDTSAWLDMATRREGQKWIVPLMAHRERIEAQYGHDELWKAIGPGHEEAWQYGYINGKLATLRWVLGSEWDFLDT
jgi:hypothetical protein